MSDADRFFENKSPLVRSARLMSQSDHAARSGDADLALRLATKALAIDPTASQVDWLLLAENSREFVARRDIFRLISLRVDHLRIAARGLGSEDPASTKPLVFVYWGQGFEEAPPVVRRCLARTRTLVPEDKLIVLDDGNLQDWIEIPSVIAVARTKSYAAYSDYVRFALLSRYGGIWLDATCYCMEDPSIHFQQLIGDGGFFAFDKKKLTGVISSWFLASAAGGYISEMNRLAQILYWSVFDDVNTYFFAHQIFRILYRIDSEFADRWDTRFVYEGNPRLVHRSLKVDISDTDFERRITSSFVHKLTYKLDPKELGVESGYQRVMSRELTA